MLPTANIRISYKGISTIFSLVLCSCEYEKKLIKVANYINDNHLFIRFSILYLVFVRVNSIHGTKQHHGGICKRLAPVSICP